jgi:hypothetical protein
MTSSWTSERQDSCRLCESPREIRNERAVDESEHPWITSVHHSFLTRCADMVTGSNELSSHHNSKIGSVRHMLVFDNATSGAHDIWNTTSAKVGGCDEVKSKVSKARVRRLESHL